MTNTTQTDLLDGVEPDAWISEVRCIGPEYGKKRYARLPIQSLQPLYYQHTRLYSRETVESNISPGILHVINLLRMRPSTAPNIVSAIDELERMLAGSLWLEERPSNGWVRAAEMADAGMDQDELRRMALEPTGVDEGEKSE
jgi:hypothetical protein